MGHFDGHGLHLCWRLAFQHCALLLHGMDTLLRRAIEALTLLQGDPALILASPIAQPVAQLFYNSLGRGGGIFYTVCAFIILQFVCFTATVSPKHLSLSQCDLRFFTRPTGTYFTVKDFRNLSRIASATRKNALESQKQFSYVSPPTRSTCHGSLRATGCLTCKFSLGKIRFISIL